jgi:hypothetical protein
MRDIDYLLLQKKARLVTKPRKAPTLGALFTYVAQPVISSRLFAFFFLAPLP